MIKVTKIEGLTVHFSDQTIIEANPNSIFLYMYEGKWESRKSVIESGKYELEFVCVN